MMKILSSPIYRILVPKYFRRKILFKVLPSNVLKYYDGLTKPHYDEIETVLNYLRTNSMDTIPYHFTKEYVVGDVEVFDDHDKGLKYVLLDGKKLYFKKIWGKERIQKSITGLLREQDKRSPHCYTDNNFKVEEGEVIVDIGAAEGIFALNAVEKASKIILFETNVDWIEALNATFEPWKDKVTIVNKFVGNINNSTNTTLDSYFPNGEKITFLKIDVEGAESKLLEGCKRILKELDPLKVAICTYHKHNDEHVFNEILKNYGFKTSYSPGYMLYYFDRKIKPPYLRRGLIRATKS
ncbi:MAG: FkbM family methyltransferase [Tenuifilaceae bacterium]